jgi:exonuclease III
MSPIANNQTNMSEYHAHPINNQKRGMDQNTAGLPNAHTHVQDTNNRNNKPKKPCKMRVNIKIATLNINGCHLDGESTLTYGKWAEVNATLKRDGIAILALQETHLNHEDIQSLHRMYKNRMEIYNSEIEHAPKSSAGVSFIINHELINPVDTEIMELIKGRALAMKLKWKENTTTLINVYAPNNKNKNQDFWKEVENQRVNLGLPKPDFLLRDFNLMEEPIDRSPPKHDNLNAVSALRDLRRSLNVTDQWRHLYNKVREYTYHAMQNQKPIKSRLDRIYIGKKNEKFVFSWTTKPSSVPTDHWLVSVRFAPKDAPHIGKG